MNKKVWVLHGLLAFGTSFTFAHVCVSPVLTENETVLAGRESETPLSFSIREKGLNTKNPLPRSIVFAPEVTMQDNTIRFITPCDGYELRLVRDGIISYSTEIDDDTLTIPATLHGTYELQIVTENYIFYTRITLP